MDHNAHNAVRIFPKETPKTAGSDESAMSSPSDLAPLVHHFCDIKKW